MFKDILFNDEAREKLQSGLSILANAVKATLGPSGRNVIVAQSFGEPVVTKDGVSVANSIELKDHLENVGAQMVRLVASKTSTDAGDGTTTATVLAEALFNSGLKAILAGSSPLGIRRGIEKGVKSIIKKLEEEKLTIEKREEIVHIGTIASNNDAEIGNLLADAMEKVGKDGVVTLEESMGDNTLVDYVEGMQFDKGYTTPWFAIGFNKLKMEWSDPAILIHEGRIDDINAWTSFLNRVATANKKVVLIASDFSDIVIQTLVMNIRKGTLQAVAVKAPGFGQRRKDILADIAAITGGTAILSEDNMNPEDITLEHCGSCDKITISADSTTIIDGGGEKEEIKKRINLIREELEVTTSDFDREKLQERLAKLTGGVAKIYVGGQTEVEMKEKKDRIEDALHAVRAAIEEGILPGGGISLLRASNALGELKVEEYEAFGIRILEEALKVPAMQIATNAGINGEVVTNEILLKDKFSHGYNALTNKYEDLLEAGIIDPFKVTKCALQNAASVAILLLTTDVIIADDPEIAEKLLDQQMKQGH